MNIKIKKTHPNAVIPTYATEGSAGFDFYAARNVHIYPGSTVIVDTGLSMEIPSGYELQIRPRSGLSAKSKVRVGNSPGTIDSDYRGEIKIILDNIGTSSYEIKVGDRIAQGVIAPVVQASFTEVKDLVETSRGNGGLGSTGK